MRFAIPIPVLPRLTLGLEAGPMWISLNQRQEHSLNSTLRINTKKRDYRGLDVFNVT